MPKNSAEGLGAPIETLREKITHLPNLNHIVTIGTSGMLIFRHHGILRPTVSTASDQWNVWQSTKNMVEQYTINHANNQHRPIIFGFEEAGKGGNEFKDVINKLAHDSRTDSNIRAWQNLAAIHRKLVEITHDGNDLYQYYEISFYADMFNRFQSSNISAFFENAPKIQTPMEGIMMGSMLNALDEEKGYRICCQLMGYVITRDICHAAQIYQELNAKSQAALVMFRGTIHAGLATALEVMAESKYADYQGHFGDIDKKRDVPVGLSQQAIFMLPLLWKRRMWEELFQTNPYLLNLPKFYRGGRDMMKTFGDVQRMLNKAPWSTFIRRTVEHIHELPVGSEIGTITLDQGDLI